MSEVKLCPFRIYTEVRPAVYMGNGDTTVMGFMECLGDKCMAFYLDDGQECCKRLMEGEQNE